MVAEEEKKRAGEPPPVIKHIIWFLDHENWVKQWKAIVIGAIFTALVGIFGIIPKIEEYYSKSHGSLQNGNPVKVTPPKAIDKDGGVISDQAAMTAIHNALATGDIDEGIRLLSVMNPGVVRADECVHVYGYAFKAKEFDRATKIIGLCWQGEEKQEKLDEIQDERVGK